MARRITRVREVGSLVAVAAFAVVGIAGCAGDNRASAEGQQASGRQAADTAKRAESKQNVAKAAAPYCSAVDNFNGVLTAVPAGSPAQVQGSLDKVSSQVGKIVEAAPDGVRKDWEKLRAGFDRLNDSYDLLDGINQQALAKLQSASSEDEVNAIGLGPKEAKKYERFQQKTSGISADVEKSGKKVSEQVEKECDISIGE